MAKEKAKETEVQETEVQETEKTETITVTVKNIPVRYNHEDYEPGDTVEIDEKHFSEELFEKEDKK